MTAALLFVERDPGLTVDGESLLERLRRQLRALGVEKVWCVARPGCAARLRPAPGEVVLESADVAGDLAVIARVSRDYEGPLILAAGDLVAHAGAVVAVASPKVRSSVALVTKGVGGGGGVHPPVVRQRNRVVGVGAGWHTVNAPNATFRGMLKVGAASVGALAVACDDLRRYADSSGRTVDELAGAGGATGLVLLALVRSGVPVGAYRVRGLLCSRVGDAAGLAEAERALREVDEERARLRLAVKEEDDFFTTFFVSSYSPRIVRLLARTRLTPTAVTWVSIALAVLAAGSFAAGTRPMMIAGAALLYVSFLFDCLDGQLARYTHGYSRFGGWLDVVADRGKEYTVYAGLAVGALQAGLDPVWPYALAMLVVQTVRQASDTWYGALHDTAVDGQARLPLDQRDDASAAPRGSGASLSDRVGTALGRASNSVQSSRGTVGYWLKRTIAFPIGERWLLIMVTASLFSARVTFACMLVAAAVSALSTAPVRVMRARAMRVAPLPDHDLALHRDDGPLARVAARWRRSAGTAPDPAPPAGAAPDPAPPARQLPGRSAGTLSGPLPLTAAVAGVGIVALVLGGSWLPQPLLDLGNDAFVLAAAAVMLLAALAAGSPHDRALDWLVPSLLRAAEYAFLVLVARNEHLPWPMVFALAGVVALFHYDLAARLDKRASPLSVRAAALGWDGRVLLLAAAAVFDVAYVVFPLLAGYLALVYVAGALHGTYAGRLRAGGQPRTSAAGVPAGVPATTALAEVPTVPPPTAASDAVVPRQRLGSQTRVGSATRAGTEATGEMLDERSPRAAGRDAG